MILKVIGPKISREAPPNWPEIEAKTGMQWGPGIVVTCKDTIHSFDPLSDDVYAHEFIHVQQVMGYPEGPEAHAKRYVEDPEFRYQQELEAYRVQWITLKRMTPAGERRAALDKLVDRMLIDLGSWNEGLYVAPDKKRIDVRRAIQGNV